MKDFEQIRKAEEAKRKAAAISNRKRLKAETVEGIDELLKVISSIHWDAVEGVSWGQITFSLDDMVKLKKHGDVLAKAFKLDGGEV